MNLKGSLTQVLISCGGCTYLKTTGIIKELQSSIEEDEDNFIYCNYIFNGIETERKRVADKVYNLKAVKKCSLNILSKKQSVNIIFWYRSMWLCLHSVAFFAHLYL